MSNQTQQGITFHVFYNDLDGLVAVETDEEYHERLERDERIANVIQLDITLADAQALTAWLDAFDEWHHAKNDPCEYIHGLLGREQALAEQEQKGERARIAAAAYEQMRALDLPL